MPREERDGGPDASEGCRWPREWEERTGDKGNQEILRSRVGRYQARHINSERDGRLCRPHREAEEEQEEGRRPGKAPRVPNTHMSNSTSVKREISGIILQITTTTTTPQNILN